MKSSLVNIYYLVQIFIVISGLIHLELFLAGLASPEQPVIWWFQVFKMVLVATFALTTQAKTRLTYFLYLPQLIFDIHVLLSTNMRWEAIMLLLAFLQLIAVIYWLDAGAQTLRNRSRLF